jgi:hypothetical protein
MCVLKPFRFGQIGESQLSSQSEASNAVQQERDQSSTDKYDTSSTDKYDTPSHTYASPSLPPFRISAYHNTAS